MAQRHIPCTVARRVGRWALTVWLLVLPAATAGAQTPVFQIDLDGFNLGPIFPVPVRLQNGTRAGAIAHVYGGWAVFVPNAPRSGLGGLVAAPGICVEWIRFTPPAPPGHTWDAVQLADGDGDGDTDVIAVSFTSPYPYLVVNLDVWQCR